MPLLPHQTFHYSDKDTEFVADPADIRSAHAFFDKPLREWCVGVSVRESYTKLRFHDEDTARDFVAQIAREKEAYAFRVQHNLAIKDAARSVKAGA